MASCWASCEGDVMDEWDIWDMVEKGRFGSKDGLAVLRQQCCKMTRYEAVWERTAVEVRLNACTWCLVHGLASWPDTDTLVESQDSICCNARVQCYTVTLYAQVAPSHTLRQTAKMCYLACFSRYQFTFVLQMYNYCI